VRRLVLALSLLLAMAAPPASTAGPGALHQPVLMAFHESWRERPATGPYAASLVAVPGYVNLVALAFARPDMVYRGDLDLSGTGLSYSFSGAVLRDAVAELKRRNPAARVLVSVGALDASRWRRLDEAAVARLVRDVGADGVDIDFEPSDPGCRRAGGGRVACASDAAWIDYVQRFRRVLPRPYILSVDGWSVGAYGEGAHRWAMPIGSRYTGEMLGLLRSPAARLVDLVIVCGYDVGPGFDPQAAVAAYRVHWKGPLVLGVQTPFKGAGGPFYTLAETEALARRLQQRFGAGMMVYSLLEPVDPSVRAREHNGGRRLVQAACRGLGLRACDTLMP